MVYLPNHHDSTIKSQSTSGRHVGRRHTLLRSQRRHADLTRYIKAPPIGEYTTDSQTPSLLNDLDPYVQCGQGGDHSFLTVAAQDSLFLKHDFHLAGATKGLDNIYYVLDLTTALLGRLQNLSSSDDVRRATVDVPSGDVKCDKFVANLEHLLRCLKQIALDAIVRHYLDLVEAHILHWHDYWQHRKRIGEGWFNEWPNGQRPLSTTWPWNIKPSLLVLWGVCWMFYGLSGNTGDSGNTSRSTRNRRGAAEGNELSRDFRTRQLGSQSQPTPEALPAGKSLLQN